MLKIPVQIADRTLPRVYVSVYDEQALADNKLAALSMPVEIHSHVDEDEYVAMKLRLLETLERSLEKNAREGGGS